MAGFTNATGQANAQYEATIQSLQNLAAGTTAPPSSAAGAGVDSLDASMKQALLSAGNNGVTRTPWMLSTTAWLGGNPAKGIVLGLNPSDVAWSMPQRMAITKNLGGTVTHAWPNTVRTTYYDEARISITMQSGSLLPVAVFGQPATNGRTTVASWQPSPGITGFYAFLQLLDQPIIAQVKQGDGSLAWRSNLVTIQYASNLFPNLTLIGRFDPKGVTFTDSSQDPNKVSSWSAEFIIFDSFPRLSDNQGLSTYRNDLLQKYMQDRLSASPQTQPTPPASGASGGSALNNLGGLGSASSLLGIV